jgi:hypothetical protein
MAKFHQSKKLLQFVCNNCISELHTCMQPTCDLQREHLELLHITPWLYINILLKLLLILRERVLAHYLYCLLMLKIKPEGKGTMVIRTLPMRQLYNAGRILVMSLSEILYCASEAWWTLWRIVRIFVFSIELVCGPLQFSPAIDCVPLVPLGYALLAFELSFTFQGWNDRNFPCR